MERNSAKISLGTAVCMVVILILIIALAVVYYLGFINNSGTVAKENIDNVEKLTANSYKVYQENYKNGYKNHIRGENRIYISPDSSYELPGVESIYIDSNNDAYFIFVKDSELYKKYGEKYKVETNVANIYLCPVGTGGYVEAVFLKLDGTASSVSGYALEEKTVVECNIIEGVKNAVNVITYVYQEYGADGQIGAAGPVTLFTDINGNMFSY